MSYCTLEEAWGSDFKKHKKKTKKERRLESQEQKMFNESIDPQILIPETHRMADYRKDLTPGNIPKPDELPKPDTSNIGGYDDSFDSYISPYQIYSSDPIKDSNETVLSHNKPMAVKPMAAKPKKPTIPNIPTEPESSNGHLVHYKEGFTNTTDEQFNQLILYIFTGIFYLLILDMMYQFGKKSY